MAQSRSRRDFLRTTAGGAAIAAVGATTNYSEIEGSFRPSSRREVSRTNIETEIKRRANFYLTQRYLVVDYYRIRRKLAYSLPIRDLSLPTVQVPSISNYPWATWMTWELEQRVYSLGWAAEWFGDIRAKKAVGEDLKALAGWPRYRQYEGPDLSSGHAGRILWTALNKWSWLDDTLRESLIAGCRRHFREVSPESFKAYGQLNSVADLRALEQPHRKLHNIPLIGTIAAALTGSCTEEAEVSSLNDLIQLIFRANLDFREQGFTEGVAYDGYVLDFIADWLTILNEQERSTLLQHRYFRNFLEESYMLSAPGAPEKVAELGDVEPLEMPFHISAQAKIHRFQRDPTRAWLMRGWRTDWIRSGGLGALHPIVDELQGETPADGALFAHYAAVLRNGWDSSGLAAVISCNSSPMGHLQKDNGTILIGTRGRWLITDPGYQQYVRSLEREFTLGPTAHNFPLINGRVQSQKSPRLEVLERIEAGLSKTTVDLTSCYPSEVKAKSVIRSLWLLDRSLVVVADQIETSSIESLQYHWHGDPLASWWAHDDWALIHTEAADLWFTSPQFPVLGDNIARLPGSRGQLTLSVESRSPVNVVWWIFFLGDAPVSYQLSGNGKSMDVLGTSFAV